MITEHISDDDIQQYVLDNVNCHNDIIEHLSICPDCKTKAATYRLLILTIEQQAKPTFEFNLTDLVLSKIGYQEPAYSKNNSFVWFIVSIGIFSIGIAGYLFGQYLISLFVSISSMTLYLVFTTGITLFLFQVIEIFRNHKRQMGKLNLH